MFTKNGIIRGYILVNQLIERSSDDDDVIKNDTMQRNELRLKPRLFVSTFLCSFSLTVHGELVAGYMEFQMKKTEYLGNIFWLIVFSIDAMT